MQGGPSVPFPVFNVVSGKRYRLRLISNAPRAVFPFSVDLHNITVIEEDGIATVPVDVEALEVYRKSDLYRVRAIAKRYGYSSRSALLGGFHS